MAVNKSPWLKDLGGAIKPLRILMPVDAGSSYAIKRGEICKVGKNTSGRPGPVTTATDNALLVIADQEQKSDDVARMMPFIVPRPSDLFEFEMSVARQVKVGETFAISDSQKLAYAVANVAFRCADDSNCPEPEEKSVTRRSVTYVRGCFDEQTSYYAEITGNS